MTQACINQKCRDPCPGTCGLNAKCQVVNHNPICSCPTFYTGDPFTRCFEMRKTSEIINYIVKLKYIFTAKEEPVQIPTNPCDPSPCGPNAQCRVSNNSPSCSCLSEFVGTPPNCRPECLSNNECTFNLACINNKCKNPCTTACGLNADCKVISHTPQCVCISGYQGDPFVQCTPYIEHSYPVLSNPCQPSPCGVNAICKVRNEAGSCVCLPDYTGNPYEGCRPECVVNSDCPANKACIRSKCIDPCPGTCGQFATCQVIGHLPTCTCIPGYTGDPFNYCNVLPQQRKFILSKFINVLFVLNTNIIVFYAIFLFEIVI